MLFTFKQKDTQLSQCYPLPTYSYLYITRKNHAHMYYVLPTQVEYTPDSFPKYLTNKHFSSQWARTTINRSTYINNEKLISKLILVNGVLFCRMISRCFEFDHNESGIERWTSVDCTGNPVC